MAEFILAALNGRQPHSRIPFWLFRQRVKIIISLPSPHLCCRHGQCPEYSLPIRWRIYRVRADALLAARLRRVHILHTWSAKFQACSLSAAGSGRCPLKLTKLLAIVFHTIIPSFVISPFYLLCKKGIDVSKYLYYNYYTDTEQRQSSCILSCPMVYAVLRLN